MTPLQTLLHLTNFQGQSPLLSTIVPSVSAAFAIQAACAAPSIAYRSDRFYDLSGAATYVAVSAFSLWLPSLRAKYGYLSGGGGGGGRVFHWRQVVLCGAVGIWAVRCEFLFIFFLFCFILFYFIFIFFLDLPTYLPAYLPTYLPTYLRLPYPTLSGPGYLGKKKAERREKEEMEKNEFVRSEGQLVDDDCHGDDAGNH